MSIRLQHGRTRLCLTVCLITLATATACVHAAPQVDTRAVARARRSVCGAPGSSTDSACTVRAQERVPGGYRVVVDRRPPAGHDRVTVTVHDHGRRIDVEPTDTTAEPPRR